MLHLVKWIGWMEGRQAECLYEIACGTSAAPRNVGSWASGPLGGRAMPLEEPECHDANQEKWVLGDGSAEGGVLRETGSSPGSTGDICCRFLCIPSSLGPEPELL